MRLSRRYISLIIWALSLCAIYSSGQGLEVSVLPLYIETRPGETIHTEINISNTLNRAVTIKEVEVKLVLVEIAGFKTKHLTYNFKQNLNSVVASNETLERDISADIPRFIVLPAVFNVILTVKAEGGISTSRTVIVHVTPSIPQKVTTIVLLALLMIVLVFISVKVRGRSKKRKVKRLVKKRDKYLRLINELEKRMSSESIPEEEYRKLKDEYTYKLNMLNDALNREKKKIEALIRELTAEIDSLEKRISLEYRRVELGEISKETADNKTKKLRKKLKDLKDKVSDQEKLLRMLP